MTRTRTVTPATSAISSLRTRADAAAWIWAFILPIEVVTGIPSEAIDLVRWLGLGVVVLAYQPDPSAPLRALVRSWGLLLATLAVVQVGAALLHGDWLRPGLLMAVSVVAAGLIALRTASHRPILYGYLAGCTLSAVVTIMQLLEVPTLSPGSPTIDRFPGLATTTIILTWQLGFAIIIAIYVIAVAERGSTTRRATSVSLGLLIVALLVCGTQGGLLALLVAGGCYTVRSWRRGSLGRGVRVGLAVIATAAVVVTVAAQFGLSAATIDEFGPGSGYVNERARIDLAVEAARTIRDNPLGGSGLASFREANVLVPHFLPLLAGVAAGVLGLVLGTWLFVKLAAAVLRGPLSDQAHAVFGWALTAAMFANTFTEPVGPFTGLSKLPLFAIGLVACKALCPEPPLESVEERP